MSPLADTLAETLAWLVDIPSETGSEEAIAAAVSGRLAHLPTVRVGNSLVVGEPTGRPLVLLVGHLDTVPSQGQGPARVEGGRLHGLGAADMKGGLAVMIQLLDDPAVQEGRFDVVGVFYAAEEGPADRNELEAVLTEVDWLRQAEFAVVMEPCDRQIQVGCNGVVNARIVFAGRAAHSARPWWGENAISKAGPWLARMHAAQPVPFVIDGLEYREVMSITRAEGGIANNIIPPRFTLNLNYRFNPGRTVEEAVAHLRDQIGEADHLEVVDTAPAGPVEASHPLVTELQDAARVELAPKQGWTDVARLGAHGIPAVNFGPGESSRAHQAEEWVDLADLDLVHDALRTVLTASGQASSSTVIS